MKLVPNQLCKRVIIPKTTNKKSSNTVSSQTADLELAFPGKYLESNATTY